MDDDDKHNAEVNEHPSTPDFDEEFPDLEEILTPLKKKSWRVNDIALVKVGDVWWPAVCKKIYKKKVSVIYINCQQTASILVPMRKVKRYSSMTHFFLYDPTDKTKAGLYEAMHMVDSYKSNAAKLKMSADAFFSLPLSDQRQILNEILADESRAKTQTLPDEKSPPLNEPSTPTRDSASLADEPSTSQLSYSESPPKKRRKTPQISDRVLSTREKNKLKSAEKARQTMLKPLFRYTRTQACFNHLLKICLGRYPSRRHDSFVSSVGPGKFWSSYLFQTENRFCFFNKDYDEDYTVDYVNYLFDKLVGNKLLKFCRYDSDLRMYIIAVLVPEAVKEALRKKENIVDEEQLEHALLNGFRETSTEKKARKLNLEDSRLPSYMYDDDEELQLD